MQRLNLGCGQDIKQGYVNLDSVRMPGVDKVHDLNKIPYPFKDNTFDITYASHVLEHLDDVPGVLRELRRISKPEAKIIIRVPFFPSMYAASDPTHKHFFTYKTFDYFADVETNHIFGYLKDKKPLFKIIKRKIVFSWNPALKWIGFFVNLFPVFYQRYLAFILPSNEIVVTLQIIK